MTNALPVIGCENTKTHPPHEWVHYNIDLNSDEFVWCTGEF